MRDVLVQSSAWVDGKDYAGKVLEMNPPKLALKSLEYKAAGMLTAVDIPNGELEKMETSFTLGVQDPNILTRLNLTEGSKMPITFQGAANGEDGNAKRVVINMTGTIKEIEDSAWKPGEEVTLKVTMSLTYYKRVMDGETLLEFDVMNMVANIGGVDQLAGIRSALGRN